MSKEVAVLLAALVGGLLAQSHRIIELIFVTNQRRKKIRAIVLADVEAMVEMTDAFDLEGFLTNFNALELSTVPTIVDPALPTDMSHTLMLDNILAFKAEEVGSLVSFFRYAKASRTALVAMTSESINSSTRDALKAAALSNWSLAKKQTENLR